MGRLQRALPVVSTSSISTSGPAGTGTFGTRRMCAAVCLPVKRAASGAKSSLFSKSGTIGRRRLANSWGIVSKPRIPVWRATKASALARPAGNANAAPAAREAENVAQRFVHTSILNKHFHEVLIVGIQSLHRQRPSSALAPETGVSIVRRSAKARRQTSVPPPSCRRTNRRTTGSAQPAALAPSAASHSVPPLPCPFAPKQSLARWTGKGAANRPGSGSATATSVIRLHHARRLPRSSRLVPAP